MATNNVNIYLNTRKNVNIFRKNYYNELAKNVYNQGDKFEALLFGDKISKLYIIGSLIILDINNIDNIPIIEKTIFSLEEILNEISSYSIWVLFPLDHV